MKKLLRAPLFWLLCAVISWQLAVPLIAAPPTPITQSINNGAAALGTPYNYQMIQGPQGQISTTVIADGTSGASFVGVDNQALHTQGQAAAGVAIAGNPLRIGCRAQNGETATTTNGFTSEATCDLAGKQIIMPYANKENFLSGASNVSGTAATQLIAAPAAGIKIYVTAIQCSNSGVTTTPVSLNDNSTWQMLNPSGSGFIASFPTPLILPAATALKFTPTLTSTTIYCNAQGYSGT